MGGHLAKSPRTQPLNAEDAARSLARVPTCVGEESSRVSAIVTSRNKPSHRPASHRECTESESRSSSVAALQHS